jgi:hypothetical protein
MRPLGVRNCQVTVRDSPGIAHMAEVMASSLSPIPVEATKGEGKSLGRRPEWQTGIKEIFRIQDTKISTRPKKSAIRALLSRSARTASSEMWLMKIGFGLCFFEVLRNVIHLRLRGV